MIQGYFFHELDGLRSIKISENGADFYTLTLTSTVIVSDAVAAWAALANAHASLSLTYGASWALGRVRFSATGNFHLTLLHDLQSALGFASATMSGASDYAGVIAPYALNPIGITYDAPRPLEEVKSKPYRYERQTYLAHHYANETTLDIFVTSAYAEMMLASGLFAGRLRAYCDATASNPYSITNLTGYLDGYPFEIQSVETMGVADGHAKIRLLATLEGS